MEFEQLSSILNSNKFDVKKFENLLSNNDQGYKFFWLEAILELVKQKKEYFTFEDVIDEMIIGSWRTVTHYHLRLGHSVNGNAENYLEHVIGILYHKAKQDIGNDFVSRDRIKDLIKKYNDFLMDDKNHLTDYVPYRLIKPFADKEGKRLIDNKSYCRFIAYYNEYVKKNNEFFYNIIEANTTLNRVIVLNDGWRDFIERHFAVIQGWLRFNKALFIQDRNPGVPGVMYKIAPDIEQIAHKSLEKARDLWVATVEVTGRPLHDIYTDNDLSVDKFDLDHFVPRSYVANDELWNLTPIDKRLNGKKSNKLPPRKYIKEFVDYNYYLYKLIFDNTDEAQSKYLRSLLDKCVSQHINAVWASEKLYIPGVDEHKFKSLLKENLVSIYESAQLQGYDLW